jgi:hypothetical protein
MSNPTGMLCVIPSRLGVGEGFAVKLKLLGPVRKIPCCGDWNARKPGLGGPFNLNVQRQIQYMDNCLPEWQGEIRLDGADALDGPPSVKFDGVAQGVFPRDRRPIARVPGLKWTRPGMRFLRLIEPVSGLEVWSNPCWVTEYLPQRRLYWGDPHWQTFFSDGIRCPEELYAFARDEAFLDFGAISDHMEAVTDRQWDYFQAVTNDFNQPGVFATLHGQEWTHHVPEFGAPGHRNIYYRGSGGPALRCTDPDCNTLEKLWRKLDGMAGIHAIAVPHHSANTVMGVRWELGWNPKYEKAVEIHSVWGCSERHADDGNPLAISPETLRGEMRGRHVIDALKRGYRFGFVGGGDIHDGRPGDDLHNESYPPRVFESRPQGFTAAWVPELTRECIFDAIAEHRTYATTRSRIYLDVNRRPGETKLALSVRVASEDGLRDAVLVRNGGDAAVAVADRDPRVIETELTSDTLAPDDFAYVRVTTQKGRMAWSSPVWGDAPRLREAHDG